MTCDRQYTQIGVCKRRIMGTWLALLLSTSLLLSVQQVSAQASPYEGIPGNIELYLFAEYASGLTTPHRPPQLIAQAVDSKRISCQHKRAATISGIANVAATILESGTLAKRARCISAFPLQGGLYTLQASYIQGANWATWNCYKNPARGANIAEAPATVPLFSSQAVTLDGGASYTCIATYTAQSPEQIAAVASINWDAEVARVAGPLATAAQDLSGNDSLSIAGCSAISYKPPPAGKPAAPLDVQGSIIINTVTKQPVKIRGINWFGFNVPMGMVDGLWAGGSDATTDFSTIAYELSMLGYNAVRMPFTHDYLAKTNVWDLVKDCTILSKSQMKVKLTRPQDAEAVRDKVLPSNVSPMPKPKCNAYLPVTKNEDRFLFAIQQFVALGMYVILDYQPMGLESYAYKLDDFVSRWAAIWQKVTCLPNFSKDIAGRVFIDMMNEPDSMGVRWEAQGDRPGAEQLYLATADRLYSMTPNKMLFLFEGTGQNGFGLNWGNGFVTDQQTINSRGLSNPTRFFDQVVAKPYTKKVVFSPHVYPPSITGGTFLGKDLWSQSQVAFAYLMSQGYCASGRCITFPVLVGETGSAFKADSDKQWLKDFADFANARGAAAAYTKQPVSGWLWWAYNENSGDTGGIVKDNWQNLNWDKLGFMIDALGLTPWYRWPGTRSVRNRPGDDVDTPGDDVDTPGGTDGTADVGGVDAVLPAEDAGAAAAVAQGN